MLLKMRGKTRDENYRMILKEQKDKSPYKRNKYFAQRFPEVKEGGKRMRTINERR